MLSLPQEVRIPAHRGTIVCAALSSQVRYTSAQAAASWPRRPHHARSFARSACICNTEGSQPDNAHMRGLASFWLTNRQRRRNERGSRLGYSLKPSTRSRIWRDTLDIWLSDIVRFCVLRPAAGAAAAGKKTVRPVRIYLTYCSSVALVNHFSINTRNVFAPPRGYGRRGIDPSCTQCTPIKDKR